jgi:hypothetical protein
LGELVLFAFDLLHRDGPDLRALPLLERLLARSGVRCLRLVEALHRQIGCASRASFSKQKASPYRPVPNRDWRKIKTEAWRAANREFQSR